MALAGQNTRRPPARPENYRESKQTYFSYSLDKAFHSPEFQAKLFFTRNWVGGFYWDSLLNVTHYRGFVTAKYWVLILSKIHQKPSNVQLILQSSLKKSTWVYFENIFWLLKVFEVVYLYVFIFLGFPTKN